MSDWRPDADRMASLRLTLVTPVRNGWPFIRTCVGSVLSQSAQVEYVVQDGGSTDGTVEYLRNTLLEERTCWRSEPDSGIYDAVVKGFRGTTGEIMGWLGADDYLTPWAARTVLGVFLSHPEVEWITGIPALHFWESGSVLVRRVAPVFPKSWIRRGFYHPQGMGPLAQEAMFWRRGLWQRASAEAVLQRYRLAGDYHLWRRFAEFSPLWTVATVLGVFGVRRGQTSQTEAHSYLGEAGRAPCVLHARVRRLLDLLLAVGLRRKIILPKAFDSWHEPNIEREM